MAAGKNKLERGIRFFWDNSSDVAKDLSASLVVGSLSINGFTYEEAELTGVSETIRNYLGGHGNVEVTAQFHMDDTTTSGNMDIIYDFNGAPPSAVMINEVGTITIQIGDAGAAPVTGDLAFEGEFVLLQANAVLNGNVMVLDCRWLPSGSTAPAWGTATVP